MGITGFATILYTCTRVQTKWCSCHFHFNTLKKTGTLANKNLILQVRGGGKIALHRTFICYFTSLLQNKAL